MALRIHVAAALVGLVGLTALSAGAAPARELWPGVTFQQTLQLTANGPRVVYILRGPRPGGTTTLAALLSGNTLTGRGTVTSMQREFGSQATYAGVNGDLSNFGTGLPSGGLMQDGQLLAEPNRYRSTLGVTDDGTLEVKRVSSFGTWKGSGESHVLNGLNEVPGPGEVSLFTSAWGPSTPKVPNATAVVVFPLTSTAPDIDQTTTVQSVVAGAASVAIPAGGGVVLARGPVGSQLTSEAAAGTSLTLRFMLQPRWPGITTAIGGGPIIVRDGAPVFRANEGFLSSQLNPRAPRTAIGQLRDGRVIMVAVDGRQPGWSIGMTNFELAQLMARLGAVTAMALDAGGSTTVAFDGQLLNRPSDGAERPIADSIDFAYTGVFVRPPLDVVSPNGDGFQDTQSLSYKLVRPSSVTATLTGPGGAAVTPPEPTEQAPGSYPVPFPPQGTGALAEGTWKLTVSATDDLGQASSMTRSFTVDTTLGFLQTSVPRLFLPPGGREMTIGWKQTRPARATVTVEAKDGTVVRRFPSGTYDAGDHEVTWNGLDAGGKRVKGGVYRAHVVAKSEIGTSELVKTFTVRQIAG